VLAGCAVEYEHLRGLPEMRDGADKLHWLMTVRAVWRGRLVVAHCTTAERKLGTHFELASGPSHLPDGPARPCGQWSQNFRCLVLGSLRGAAFDLEQGFVSRCS
jgi:hypothetical protein